MSNPETEKSPTDVTVTPPSTPAYDPARKKRVRGGHRAHLTKLVTEATRLLIGYVEDRESQVRAIENSLLRKSELLKKFDEEILEMIEDSAEMMREIETSENIQNEIEETIFKIKKATKKEVKAEPATKPAAEKRKMKLPKYDVDDFFGDPKKWRSFKDSFDVAVLNDSDLDDVEKFHYLRKYLGRRNWL